MKQPCLARQEGATLIVGLIMLVLITLMVTTAFNLSSTNLKAVANMQFRNEAMSAANRAIEQVVSSPFTEIPAAQSFNVDINNDGNVDYVVAVDAPTCIQATQSGTTTLSSLSLPASMSVAQSWNTIWEIKATVTDAASNTNITVKSGVRVLRSDSQKQAECT